ncbi:uncharacterized protein LOC131658923 [Vicia villosa]|uniref:uncharacterized protein LOC131658923 n=1 Tax=Vicia villosa TaxID=3911 RepID=UPI00273B7215|nr:uncharacterized protein LOC131658923 [Vicia villosa]
MDEVYSNWKRLWFDNDGVIHDSKTCISIQTEWEIIQDIFAKEDDTMKSDIKEQLRKIAYPTPTVQKGARISKSPPPPLLPNLPEPLPWIEFVDEMPLFMHKHIERIGNVGDDGNCVFWDVSGLLDKGENGHQLICIALLKKLNTHRELYTKLYSGKAPFSKWMCFLEKGHLIASAYDRVCIDLIRYGFSATFFSLPSGPPKNPFRRIMCIWFLPNDLHFVQVILKPGCPIPATSIEWTTHSTNEEETWPDKFMERMIEFTKLMEFESESNKEASKAEPLVDICDTGSFMYFRL